MSKSQPLTPRRGIPRMFPCEREQRESLMPVVIHVHHDAEAHARSFNEGYEAAVTQGLADDPSLADDWFQEKIREAKTEVLRELADDFSVNLTNMSGPRIRKWILARTEGGQE